MAFYHEMRQRIPWLLLSAVVVVLLIINYFHNPEFTSWSPKCIMLQLTGYKCPGCGSQRFAYYFMHGDILKAIHYNYYIALLSPYLLLLLSGEVIPSRRWRQYVLVHFATKFYCLLYVALYLLWWILRNIWGL